MSLIDKKIIDKKRTSRLFWNNAAMVAFFLCTLVGLLVLAMLIYDTLSDGLRFMRWDFITNFASARNVEVSGFYGAIIG